MCSIINRIYTIAQPKNNCLLSNYNYKENVDGRITSSHENKKFRIGSVEKQRGMAFGFRKLATAVKKKPDR